MEHIELNPSDFNIVDVWDDNGDVYVTVEVGVDMFVDVKYPNCTISDVQAFSNTIYSYPMENCNGGYVYSSTSEGYTTAEISEKTAWEIVYFVDREIGSYLAG